jgi:predicted DNA-binding helix-hairpin-helix protein
MELEEKLRLLGGAAADDFEETARGAGAAGGAGGDAGRLEAAGSPCGVTPRRGTRMAGITEVALPGGGSVRLLRVMMTNVCRFSCRYCAIRAGRKMRRASFAPEELAAAFLSAWRRGLCEGLFITSAIPGPSPRMMDKMLALAEILRRKENYEGYIHIKILPGAEPAQIERAAQLANRISLNLEAATDAGLASLSAEKNLGADLLPRLTLAGTLAARAKGDPSSGLSARSGATTQFVIGAGSDADRAVLALAGSLYARKLLHHAHYAAFQPVIDTPMEDHPAVPLLREHRLYQADYLLRLYGFRPDELVFDGAGNILLENDPKLAWALAHPERFPVDAARAPFSDLLRVPGVGRTAARRILEWRRTGTFRDLEDLRKIGVRANRAKGFLSLSGRRLATHMWEGQKDFWAFAPVVVRRPLKTDDPPCAYR